MRVYYGGRFWQRGFSLIEIVVAIVVVALTAAGLMRLLVATNSLDPSQLSNASNEVRSAAFEAASTATGCDTIKTSGAAMHYCSFNTPKITPQLLYCDIKNDQTECSFDPPGEDGGGGVSGGDGGK